MNIKGISEKATAADLVKMFPVEDLMVKSADRSITRHFVNVGLILPHTEHVLLNWLIFMADTACTFKYTTMLLQQFNKASERAQEIYGTEHPGYNRGIDRTRDAFISLVEKGYIVNLGDRHMINPIIAYGRAQLFYSGARINKEYQEVLKQPDFKEALKEWCRGIDKNIKSRNG